MQSVAHGMIEISMPVGTFLRSGLTVWEQESPCFSKGRKSTQPAKVEAVKRELVGKDLICFCAPKGCHGDVLLKVANV